jgi:outer membrane protein
MWSSRPALASAAVIGLLAGAGGVRAETLLDAIDLAYKTNPTLQQQRATQRALDEEYVQSLAQLRPTLNITGGEVFTHSSENDTTFQPGPLSINAQNAAVNLTQPLTTGGAATEAIRAAERDVLQGREQLRATEIMIMTSVIQFYVDVIRDTVSVQIDRSYLLVLQRQLQQTSAEFDVGQVTQTDVSQAEARLALAQAALSAAEGQLQISRANFTQAVGLPPGELAPPPALPGIPASFDAALDVAEQENPALRGAQYAEEAARSRVGEARAAYRPTVSVNASFQWQRQPLGQEFFNTQFGTVPFQVNPYNRTVTMSAIATIPLFSGGMRGSKVRQALEQDNEAIYSIENERRVVLQAVSQAWASVTANNAQILADEVQVKAAALAAEGQRQETQVGLRTTIDVLNAEQQSQTAQLQLIDARHDEYVGAAQLLAAMGRLQIRYLNPDLPAYDPKRNFDRVRNKGWLPIDEVVRALDAAGAPREHNPYTPTSAPIDPDLTARSVVNPQPKEP